MTAKLSDGEETILRTFKLPDSLDRKLRARAVLDATPLSEIVRAALDEYLRARSG